MSIEAESRARDGRANNGRKPGATMTEPSTLVARIRVASGLSQGALAQKIDAREKTVWRYEKESIIPMKGAKREALEKLAKEYKVPISEGEK